VGALGWTAAPQVWRARLKFALTLASPAVVQWVEVGLKLGLRSKLAVELVLVDQDALGGLDFARETSWRWFARNFSHWTAPAENVALRASALSLSKRSSPVPHDELQKGPTLGAIVVELLYGGWNARG